MPVAAGLHRALAMSDPAAPPSPFQGLREFQEEDAGRFFARELWTKIIVGNVVASRLTLLYGESGVGKTSLLQAGVEHELHQRGRGRNGRPARSPVIPIVFRAWQGEAVRPLIDHVHPPEDGGAPAAGLPEALRGRASRDGGRVALILDQFEEYLLYHARDEGPDSLPAQLARTLDEPRLPATVLISIRADALSKLDPLKQAIPRLFDNLLHLERVDKHAAAETITGPIDWYNEHQAGGGERVEIEESLVEAILGEVTPDQAALVDGGQDRAEAKDSTRGETVEFAYLQLVLERLWDEAHRTGSRRLGIAMLRELPGGAQEIVRDHVRQAVERLSEDEQDVLAEVFRYLVTPSGGKIAYTVADLAEQVGREPEALRRMLETLSSAEARILRPVGVATAAGVEDGVEIYHDKLAGPILYWRSDHLGQREREQAKREAREAERKRMRRLRWGAFVGIAVGVALVTTVLLVLTLDQKQLADRQRELASSRGIAAAASSQLAQDPELSLLLGVEAVKAGHTSQATEALRAALVQSRVRRVLRGHSLSVTPIGYTRDGRRVITASNDGSVRIWDARTGRPERAIRTGAPVRDMQVSPDGRRIATVSGPRAKLWSVSTGRPIAGPPDTGRGDIHEVAFNRRGDRVATGGADHTVRVWRPGGGARVVGSHGAAVRSVEFAPDGTRLVSASADGARIWAVRGPRGVPLHTLGGGLVLSASFSHDGRLVVTAGADKTARLWDAATGRQVRVLRGHRNALMTAVFSPDDTVVATGSIDQTARLWDTATGTTRAVLGSHRGTVRRIVFGDSGRRVATGSQDGTARVWSTASGRSVLVLRGHAGAIQRLAFSPDEKSLATSSLDTTARIWEADPERRAPPLPSGRGRRAREASFTNEGRQVASLDRDGSLAVRAAETGKVQRRVRAGGGAAARASFTADGSRTAVLGRDGRVHVIDVLAGRTLAVIRPRSRARRATLVAHGREVATLGGGIAQLWSAGTGRPMATLRHHPDRIADVAVSEDGKLALTTGSKGQIGLWRARTGRRIGPLVSSDAKRLMRAAFSPDAKLAVAAQVDGTVRIYDVPSLEYKTSLLGHAGRVGDVAFSPDGTVAVTAGYDGTARVWNPTTGKSLAVLGEDRGRVRSPTFSRDGRFVLDVSDDGFARVWLWSLGESNLAQRLSGASRGGIESAHFDPSGKRVVATGADGAVRVYSCEVCGGERDLVALALSRATRSLTASERREFGAGD